MFIQILCFVLLLQYSVCSDFDPILFQLLGCLVYWNLPRALRITGAGHCKLCLQREYFINQSNLKCILTGPQRWPSMTSECFHNLVGMSQTGSSELQQAKLIFSSLHKLAFATKITGGTCANHNLETFGAWNLACMSKQITPKISQ